MESEHEKLLMRLGTAVGKYWICKRTPHHAYEAMECLGGDGFGGAFSRREKGFNPSIGTIRAKPLGFLYSSRLPG